MFNKYFFNSLPVTFHNQQKEMNSVIITGF